LAKSAIVSSSMALPWKHFLLFVLPSDNEATWVLTAW
jgi:hypothetical protein